MHAWLACAALLLALPALAQDPPPEVLLRQHGGIYVEPPSGVDPLYVPDGPRGWTAPGQPGHPLDIELSLEMPLPGRKDSAASTATQGPRPTSATWQALLRWRPMGAAPWFAQLVFYRYLQPSRQQSWNPDYSYAFGYDDGRPDTWHLVYANFTGTRLHPHGALHEGRLNFPEGQWTLGRRFSLPLSLQPLLLVGDGDRSTCSADLHLTPRYDDERAGKLAASLGCLYERPGGWYLQAELFAYPQRSQQQPWDPDFTYGLGWKGAGPGTFSLRYSNYSGNRWPWRHPAPGEGRFNNGSIGVSWSLPL